MKIQTQRFIDRWLGQLLCSVVSGWVRFLGLFSAPATLRKEPKNILVILLSEIVQTFGGARFYLPRGKSIEVMVRSMMVWKAFTGNNTYELSRQFKVSMREIQYILARMRKLEARSRQRDMFAGTEQAAPSLVRKHGRLY